MLFVGKEYIYIQRANYLQIFQQPSHAVRMENPLKGERGIENTCSCPKYKLVLVIVP